MERFLIFFVLGVGALIVLAKARGSGRFFSSVFLTALQGVAALFAVNLAGSFFGLHVNINPFSLGVGGVFGTAGVILLLLFESLPTS